MSGSETAKEIVRGTVSGFTRSRERPHSSSANVHELFAQIIRRCYALPVLMQRVMRLLGVLIPIFYLTAMSLMVEAMFPGWIAVYFSFEYQSISERFFLFPVILFVLAAATIGSQWLLYLIVVELFIFVPTLFQMLRMMEKEHAHPWLGLGGLYQLAWMLAAVIAGLVGRWIWRRMVEKDRAR